MSTTCAEKSADKEWEISVPRTGLCWRFWNSHKHTFVGIVQLTPAFSHSGNGRIWDGEQINPTFGRVWWVCGRRTFSMGEKVSSQRAPFHLCGLLCYGDICIARIGPGGNSCPMIPVGCLETCTWCTCTSVLSGILEITQSSTSAPPHTVYGCRFSRFFMDGAHCVSVDCLFAQPLLAPCPSPKPVCCTLIVT